MGFRDIGTFAFSHIGPFEGSSLVTGVPKSTCYGCLLSAASSLGHC